MKSKDETWELIFLKKFVSHIYMTKNINPIIPQCFAVSGRNGAAAKAWNMVILQKK